MFSTVAALAVGSRPAVHAPRSGRPGPSARAMPERTTCRGWPPASRGRSWPFPMPPVPVSAAASSPAGRRPRPERSCPNCSPGFAQSCKFCRALSNSLPGGSILHLGRHSPADLPKHADDRIEEFCAAKEPSNSAVCFPLLAARRLTASTIVGSWATNNKAERPKLSSVTLRARPFRGDGGAAPGGRP